MFRTRVKLNQFSLYFFLPIRNRYCIITTLRIKYIFLMKNSVRIHTVQHQLRYKTSEILKSGWRNYNKTPAEAFTPPADEK